MKITKRQLNEIIRESLNIKFHKNPTDKEKEAMLKTIMAIFNVEKLQ